MTELNRKLQTLTAKKLLYFEKLQTLYDLSKDVASKSELWDKFMVRYKDLEEIKSEFESVVAGIHEIQLKQNPEGKLSNSDLISFDNLYYEVQVCANKCPVKVKDCDDSKSEYVARPRLPKIELVSFSGEYEQWTTFHDTFTSLVHNNTTISDIDKFHYLLSCTKGQALNIVKSLPITAANYAIIWKGLLEKYQDTRTLASRYLDKMLNFTPLTKESAVNLNTFIETFEHSLHAIKSLNIDDLANFVLCHIALRGLDMSTRKQFERVCDQKKLPLFDDVMKFVHNQIKILERSSDAITHSSAQQRGSTSSNPAIVNNNKNKRTNFNKVSLTTSSHSQSSMICYYCGGKNHMIYKCFKFIKLSPVDRQNEVHKLKLCLNCLKKDHDVRDCKSTITCTVCKSKHNLLLHSEGLKITASPLTKSNVGNADNERQQSTCCHSLSEGEDISVVLGTAIVHIADASGTYQPVRAVIDPGAQTPFITERCVKRLGLERVKCHQSVSGLAVSDVPSAGATTCHIKPCNATSPTFQFKAIVLPKITVNMPNVIIPKNVVCEYNHLCLADPKFYESSEVELLLANDIAPDIQNGPTLKIKPNIPRAMSTVFGYVITGKLEPCSDIPDNNASRAPSCLLVSMRQDPLSNALAKFWEIESVPCTNVCDPLDEQVESIYVNKQARDPSGRYIVPLPLTDEADNLGDSFQTASKRFMHLERKLSRSPELRNEYVKFMREYNQLGHMDEYTGADPSKYIISHHAVFKPSSTSTPVRVVFDASAKTSSNKSLNDVLLPGPKLQRNISDIIIGFRLYSVCLSADIAKMYRQILIDPTHRSYQHILWRESPTDELKTYELKTVTYGMNCSPYLAIRTLHQLAHDEQNAFPKAAQVVREGFYMDDLLWSVETVDEACTLQDELMAIMRLGGFELKKWSSNNPELLSRIPLDYHEKAVAINEDQSIKVLGVQWLPDSDCFTFFTNLTDSVTTKRSVLRLLASIFDPIGLVSPCIFLAKCIMQDLWKLGTNWDDSLPPELKIKWQSFISELPILSRMRVERHVLIPNYTECELIGFCDASERGYGVVVYARSIDARSNVKINILCSKSKVAPVKTVSIPRLELMAAVLLSNLIKYLQTVMHNVNITKITALSDSTVVLCWLQTPPYQLQTFVANRVCQVTEIIPASEWSHVRSENNAADVCSRGATPTQLVQESEWLSGPSWLRLSSSCWPISKVKISEGEVKNLPEIKLKVDAYALAAVVNENITDESFIIKFSSYRNLQRVIAWCLRFINNIQQNVSDRRSGALCTFELRKTNEVLIKTIQRVHFDAEISALTNGKPCSRTMSKLAPFMDARGILMVGGRLSQADMPYRVKHPVLLPNKSHFTRLIIQYYHVTYLHAGPRALQGILSQSYWIMSARRVIRSVLTKCIACFKCKPVALQPIMANLPSSRLIPGKVFKDVGVDLGGPFYIKESMRRNAQISKAYLCLFVCYSTKAVHLEVLSSLSADSFLACLDRFVARRGLCDTINSDNGTNFVASSKHLRDVHKFFASKENQELVMDGFTSRNITWKFNPPTGSHFGGLHEAGIKSAKYHLKRVIGDSSLTFEELTTLFCKIEAILNSRPLCSLSDDPNEFEVLTAGHFLIGQNLLAVPEYSLEDVPQNRLSRWQLIQSCSQHFWKRWQRDYLHTLQQRSKWLTSQPNIKVDDLVLVKSDQSVPLHWPLGRVERLHPGADGTVRVVTLKTKNGLIKRPVVKLCPLPTNN